MSTQTEHLGLHQWEAGDPFLRSDFNEDFAKLDAGVAAAAQPPYAVGTVELPGAGTQSAAVTVELGFTPSAVLVAGKLGFHTSSPSSTSLLYNSQGFAVRGAPSCAADLSNAAGSVGVEIVEGGFVISQMKTAANPYRYIAFR